MKAVHVAWSLPLLALLALLAFATPASAAVTGPCTGTINGDEIHGRVTVPENGTVAWNFDSTGGFVQSWVIELVFLGQSIILDEGNDEDPDKTSIGGLANVTDYARQGVGVYELTGTVMTEGGACTGSVEVVVQGNPLTSLLGAVGAGAAVLGGGGAAAAGAMGAKGLLAGLKP